MRRALALAILAAQTAHAAPPLEASAGSERAVDAPATIAALDSQKQAALAYGAGVYLAVWTDTLGSVQSAVMCARIATNGTPMDDPPIRLAGGTAPETTPAVAFDASSSLFVVVWDDTQSSMVHGAYVLPAGGLSAKAFSFTSNLATPVIASGGGTTLIAYRDGAIKARFIASDGTPSAPLVLDPDGSAANPAVAWGTSGYLVAWQSPLAATNGEGIWGALVRPGSPPSVAPTGQLIANPGSKSPQYAQVAFGGNDFLVAWSEFNGGPAPALAGNHVRLDVPDAGVYGGAFSIAGFPPARENAQLVAVGGNYLAVWEDWTGNVTDLSTLSALRIGVDATPQSVSTLNQTSYPRLPHDSRAVALATDGTNARLAWVLSANLNVTLDDVYTLPIANVATTPPAAVDSKLIASGPSTERAPAVASNGSVFLAVWEDSRNVGGVEEGIDLYAQLFDASGNPSGAVFALVEQVGDQRSPAVAALPGDDFLVAWSDGRYDPPASGANPTELYYQAQPIPSGAGRTWIARVGADGTVRDAGGVALLDPVNSAQRDRFPQVAADPAGARWLVSWDYDDSNPNHTDVALAAIGSDGKRIAAADGQQIHFAPVAVGETRCAAQAAFSGGHFVMVMESNCFLGTQLDVRGLMVAADGTPAASDFAIATSSSIHELAPTVAASGSAVVAAWEERASFDPDTATPGTIAIAALAANGTPMRVAPFASGSKLAFVYPRLAAVAPGFLLAWEDFTAAPTVMRGVRLSASGVPDPEDVGALAQLSPSMPAVAAPLPDINLASTNSERDRTGPSVAAGALGQVLLAWAADQPAMVGRVHERLLRGRSAGDACDRGANGALGCADGRCERDPSSTSTPPAGRCCAVECSGPCRSCGAAGCVDTPKSDAACGMVDCSALTTACRSFAAAPARCLGFGECARSDDLASCGAGTPINEGGACASPGCSSSGACTGGACLCPDAARDQGGPRALPASCSFGDSAPSGAWLIILVLLALSRRRLLAVALLAAACSNDHNALTIDLALDDATLRETARVRLTLRDTDASNDFLAAAPSQNGDETIRNLDLDGDGRVEIVVDLGGTFPFTRKTTYLKIVPNGPQANVQVSAAAFNRYGNPIASTAPVPAVLPGGSLKITLACASSCTGSASAALGAPTALDAGGHAVSALDASTSGALVAAGVAGAGDAAHPQRGAVYLLRADDTGTQLGAPQELDGENAGDRFGAALALGDLDGDGVVDLAVGAPGHGNGAGRVYLYFGDLAAPPRMVSVDGQAGEQLGASLALATRQGAPVIAAGAPGLADSAGAIYFVAATGVAISASGPSSGAHLGGAIAARGAHVVASMPGVNQVALYDGSGAMSTWSSQSGGGLGAALALLDLDGKDVLSVAAARSASSDVLLAPFASSALDDTMVSHALHPTGSWLATLRTPFGDELAVAAPGAALIVEGGAISVSGAQMPLDSGNSVSLTATLGDANLTSAASATLLASGRSLFIGDDQGRLYIQPRGAP
jgi:hypothetical protein